MKNSLFILTFIILSGCAVSGSKMRILETPAQPFGNRFDTLTIKRIRVSRNSDSVVLKLKDKRKLKISANEIWGYQDLDSTIFRYTKEDFFLVRQLDTPTIYSRRHSYGKGSHTHYYFSVDPYSPIYSFRWKDIKKQFSGNECFINKLKELNFFQNYESYDRKKKTYRFVTLYKECNK